MNLWAEYTDIVYAYLTPKGLSFVQLLHETTKRDQFLMKLRYEFEGIFSNIMHRNLAPSLDACFNYMLHEEQCLLIESIVEDQKSSIIPVAYVARVK